MPLVTHALGYTCRVMERPCQARTRRAVPCRNVPCQRTCRARTCRAVPCQALPCQPVPCRAVPSAAVPARAVPCRAMCCRASPCHVLPVPVRGSCPHHTCKTLLRRLQLGSSPTFRMACNGVPFRSAAPCAWKREELRALCRERGLPVTRSCNTMAGMLALLGTTAPLDAFCWGGAGATSVILSP